MVLDLLARWKADDDFDRPLDISAYVKMMGFRLRREQGRLTMVMPFNPDLVGSPYPPALHGGTVAALMEMAAIMELTWDIDMARLPRAIDISVDYLRSGKPEETFARARVFRKGRRFATLHVEAWQAERKKPIATAVLHFQLVD